MQNKLNGLKHKKALWIELLLLLIGLLSFLYWGNKKQPWFCDEIYTYESANGFEQDWPASRTAEWMTGSDVEDFFSADWNRLSLKDISDRLYSDHVPLYFWLFRMISLFFFPGSGSVWIGLSMNLVFYLIILIIGYRIFLYLTHSPLFSGTVTLLTLVANRLILEQITTLRMYTMLLLAQMLLLLAALWILRDSGGSKMKPGALVFLYAVSVMGFLTHYDFWIFYAVTAALFCLWLFLSSIRRDKRFWITREFRYVLSWVVNFGCSLLTTIFLFPYCRWNLNRGKGQIALLSIFDFSSEKIGKIMWGYEHLATSIFGDVFPVIGALLLLFGSIAGGAFLLYKKKERIKLAGMVLVVLAAQAYQLIVCFTMPDAWEERYLWGSYTIMMLCMAWGAGMILQAFFQKIQDNSVRRKMQGIISIALTIGILAIELAAIDGGNGITYLFHPDKDVSLLREYSDIPWIVYGPTGGVYSYYDWIIPEQICFLSTDHTEEERKAFNLSDNREQFVLYLFDDYLTQALAFFEETSGRSFTAQYLTQSTNLAVYLISAE